MDGSWVLRAAGGYTKRANSAQCLNPADDDDAPARIERVAHWFEARSLTPTFRITPLSGPGLVQTLAKAGWAAFDHSNVLARPLTRGQFTRAEGAALVWPTEDSWLDTQQELQGYDGATRGHLRAVVSRIGSACRGVTLRSAEGSPLASAIVSIADHIAIFGNVVTAAAARRQGHGRVMMQSALAWAAEAGATTAALAVAGENAPAHRLYASLGFTPAYDYHYRRPGR
jgi:GNAT superfamily N-acetyltransferase